MEKSKYDLVLKANRTKLAFYGFGLFVVGTVLAVLFVQNLMRDVHHDVNTGNIIIDIIELLAERSEFGWWFSTLVLGAGFLIITPIAIWFIISWYKQVDPVSVRDGNVYVWGRKRLSVASIQKFSIVGERAKSTIQATTVTGETVKLCAVSILATSGEKALSELKSQIRQTE